MAAKATSKSRDRRAGRRDSLAQGVEQQLLAALRTGATIGEAAAAAGISRSTVHRWVARGEGQDGRFQNFAEAVAQARAEAKVGAIAAVRRAMPEDWRAAAFYLERTDPEQWGRRTAHELTGADGKPIALRGEDGQRDFSKLSDDELAELQRLLERADGDA
jgi:Homeodomain-like domain